MENDLYIFPTATITPYSAGAYASGQMVGGAFQFNLKAQKIGGLGGIILGVTCMDNDLEGAAGELFIFGGAISAYADRAAFDSSITFLDMQKRLGRVIMGTFESYTNVKIYNTDNQATPFKPIPYASLDSDGILSGVFKATGTPTYAALKSLIFKLHILTR